MRGICAGLQSLEKGKVGGEKICPEGADALGSCKVKCAVVAWVHDVRYSGRPVVL